MNGNLIKVKNESATSFTRNEDTSRSSFLQIFSQPLWNKNLNSLIRFAPLRGVRHLSHKTEDAYHNFIKRFILFHNKRHPKEMGAAEITAFFDTLRFEPDAVKVARTVLRVESVSNDILLLDFGGALILRIRQ